MICFDSTIRLSICVFGLVVGGCSTLSTRTHPFSTPESKTYCGYYLERKAEKYTVTKVIQKQGGVSDILDNSVGTTISELSYNEEQVLRLFELTGNHDIRKLFHDNYGERLLSGIAGGLGMLPLGALLATGGTDNGMVQLAVGTLAVVGVFSITNAFRNPKDGLVKEYNQRVRRLCP